ncbi:P-loop containing nucleoside triphosphate hydrolase protein [Tribonema minus]|uniref:Kinesin-like protein n=1 Tax=Tribonema minus TaxID=303371 RepID=A0A835Z8L1_9STRA|nr:P-loop containing nucleoside triphosphate hydrolase protein [Tribonema minus]
MEAICVAVRIRPEAALAGSSIITSSDDLVSCVRVADAANKVTIACPARACLGSTSQSVVAESATHEFIFDRVFDAASRQEEVFTLVRPLVNAAADGYVATVFAYGMTGSGKTHTISGTGGDVGMLPRAVSLLLDSLKADAAKGPQQTIFMVTISFVEIYNNTFVSLLSAPSATTDGNQKIEIRESPTRGVYLTGGTNLRLPVTCTEEAMQLIHRGMEKRATSCTNMNERSSRSHAILTFEVERSTASVRVGKLQLIDLAGSERVGLSGAEGSVLAEAQSINLSLSLLGDVLSALSKYHRAVSKGLASATERPFIPYRNSKLTHLLKDSLGGNCKTLMVCCIR